MLLNVPVVLTIQGADEKVEVIYTQSKLKKDIYPLYVSNLKSRSAFYNSSISISIFFSLLKKLEID